MQGVHFRGLFNFLHARGGAPMVITATKFAKSVKSLDFNEIHWNQVIGWPAHELQLKWNCSWGSRDTENLIFSSFLERSGDSVDKFQKIDIFTFSDSKIGFSIDISTLSARERFWSILVDPDHPSLLLKLHKQLSSFKIMISKKFQKFSKNSNIFLWQVSTDLDNSKKPGTGANRKIQAFCEFAARAGWAKADQSLWLTLPGV